MAETNERWVRSESSRDMIGNSIFYGLCQLPGGGRGIQIAIYGADAVRHEYGPMLPSHARFMAQRLLHFADTAETKTENVQ